MLSECGIGTFLKNAIKALSQHDLNLLSFQQIEDFPCILMKSPIYSLGEQVELCRKVPRCDLFISPHFNVPLLPIRAKKRMAVVHDVYHLAYLSTMSWAQKFYAQVFYNGAFLLSDRLITVSEFSKSEILKYATFKPKKIDVIANTLYPQKKAGKAVQNYILAVGNSKPHKNLKRLIEAASSLEQELVIVGKKEGFAEKKKVRFTGFVSDSELQDLYANASLLVFPSLYEGFGFPPLEAMQQGCPTVVSKAASLPEVCGEAAEYVDPYSVDSIREGIVRGLKNRDELIKKGYDQVKKFHFERFKEEFLKVVYESCDCS